MGTMDKDTQPMSQDADDAPNGPSDSPLWGLIYWMKDNSKDCERLVMSKDEYTVGRVSGCDVILNQDNCCVKIENLSRVHFTIKRVPNIITGYQIVLQDLSSNGTFVNGEKIGKNMSRALCHGDEIGLTCKLQRNFMFLDPMHKPSTFPPDISNKYSIVKALGKGSFGEVWLAVHKTTNKKYAIKSVRREGKYSDENGFDAMEQLKNEAQLLCALKHPCIVKVEEIVCRAKSLHLVLELMCGGDLQQSIRTNKKQLSEFTAKFFFTQLVLAVQYFHDLGIVHRDLKPENVLLSSDTDNAILKITDFGLSKLVDENTKLKTYCGTPLYLAPEVIEAKSREINYTKSCDVWSLGVILFFLLSGSHPFINRKISTPLDKLISRAEINWNSEKWSKVSSDARDLVQEMLQVDPEQRPSILDILDHPWMNDIAVSEKIQDLVLSSRSSIKSCRSSDWEDQPLSKRRKTELN